jgi:hypothetical protein
MKKILFIDANMTERGTSSATFDYATYNMSILGNESFVVTYSNSPKTTYAKFAARFDVRILEGPQNLPQLVDTLGVDCVYMLKYGFNDGVRVDNAKNLVHVVFPSYDPHGDVYAYVSEVLAQEYGHGSPWVPHMIDLPDCDGDLRSELGLGDKLVFGWYGGFNFEIPFAQQAVAECARTRGDVAFVFMNMPPFCDEPNVHFLPMSADPLFKARFINSCDAMVHANSRGETFGISVGEFSTKNKPVIAFSLKETHWPQPGRSYLRELGEKGIFYDDKSGLSTILMNACRSDFEGRDWRCYTQYTPEKVMSKFASVFLS